MRFGINTNTNIKIWIPILIPVVIFIIILIICVFNIIRRFAIITIVISGRDMMMGGAIMISLQDIMIVGIVNLSCYIQYTYHMYYYDYDDCYEYDDYH